MATTWSFIILTIYIYLKTETDLVTYYHCEHTKHWIPFSVECHCQVGFHCIKQASEQVGYFIDLDAKQYSVCVCVGGVSLCQFQCGWESVSALSVCLYFTICQSIGKWQCVSACLCSNYYIFGSLHELAYTFWFWFYQSHVRELLTESTLFSAKPLSLQLRCSVQY